MSWAVLANPPTQQDSGSLPTPKYSLMPILHCWGRYNNLGMGRDEPDRGWPVELGGLRIVSYSWHLLRSSDDTRYHVTVANHRSLNVLAAQLSFIEK